MVAIKKQKMLTVGENGSGSLFDIKFKVRDGAEVKSIQGEDIGRQQNQVTVKIENRRDFKMPEIGTIVSLELNPESHDSNDGTFIIGLKSGKVFIFDLETNLVLAALNSNDWAGRTSGLYKEKR